MAESTASVSATTFRAKVAEMRAWRPENPPSNRDKLELYALHKQAVSSDAPSNGNISMTNASPADKAKLSAWRSKRGLSQSEAMNLYIAESDRQQRVYGSKIQLPASAASSSTVSPGGTPTNTPAFAEGQGDASGLSPRGMAAVPLLCAAAAESRTAYLARLKSTNPQNGWWAKQEPLCADPGTAFATPENIVLFMAERAETLALNVESASLPVPATVVQSFLWPLHNVLLAIWIVLIFICTFVGSVMIALKTLLMGVKRTKVPLSSVFAMEIEPAAKAANSLCATHQALSVRLVGLALMPLVTICDVGAGTMRATGTVAGSAILVTSGVLTWWYWICVLPWLAFAGICLAILSGWCFAIIEVAGI